MSFKIRDLLKKFEDTKVYFEVIEHNSGASIGFFHKNELLASMYADFHAIKLNVQYVDDKRLLVIYI